MCLTFSETMKTRLIYILDQPEVLTDRMPRGLIWALGFSERLDCPVDANPPVTQIIWTKNGIIIDFGTSPLIQLTNGSLLVNQVTQSDAGNYRCTAISSYGNGDSEIVQVEVKGMYDKNNLNDLWSESCS